jgi:hypothetical protein
LTQGAQRNSDLLSFDERFTFRQAAGGRGAWKTRGGNHSESEDERRLQRFRGCKAGGALFEEAPARGMVPSLLSREDPQRLFEDLGLLSSSGKARLNVAQGFFNRAENQEDLELLEQLYVFWRDLSEYLVLRSLKVHPRTMASVWSYVGVKSSKRGNDVYRSRVKRRLDWLSNMPNVSFFDVSDFYDEKGWRIEKPVYSQALWLTLTYDTKLCSRAEAMQRIGPEWNRFLSALRSKYGQVSVLRSWESSGQGYPHVHACLLFKEARFDVEPWLSKDDEKETHLTFRIKNREEISSLWHSHVDIQAVSSTRKLFNYMRKYQTKTLMASDSPKGVRTMSVLWLHRKRSFSVSGDFRSRISDLIRTLHNSNMELRQSRLDGSLQEASVWEFVGVFSGQELGHHGKSWTFKLDKPQIELVLTREAESRARMGGGFD